ncbi:hypothetical protein MMC25_003242 [Agyrium rufum]|nr:hypothetical protein [Agyrium rufum]
MTHLSSIADFTTGILFMGTPHRGSEQAYWGGILASILGYVKQGNAELIKRLNKEEPHLALLQERFIKLLEIRKERNRPISITCFYEELPVPVLGTIVPALSAQIDPYSAIGIHANHLNMTKFGGDDSAGYIKVVGELRRFVQSAMKLEAIAGDLYKGSNNFNAEEGTATSRSGGITFHGAIKGRNVIAGMQNAGTTNLTFG